MNKHRQILGVVIVVIVIIGLVFGVGSILGTLIARAPVLNAANTALDVVSDTLALAELSAARVDGIVVAGQERLSTAESSTRDVAARLQDGREQLAARALGPVQTITATATDLQVRVTDWQLMLTSADRILGRLSRVGPLDLDYQSPEQLLADIEELNVLLTQIIDEGNRVGTTIAARAEEPGPIGRRVLTLADGLSGVQTKIDDTRARVASYLQQLRDLQARAITFVGLLPLLLTLITLSFLCLTLAGVAGLIKGLEMAGAIKTPL